MVSQQHTDHHAEPGHAATGQGRHHDEAEATNDPQRQAGSPVPSSNIHSPRCVLSAGLGTWVVMRCSQEVKLLSRDHGFYDASKDNSEEEKNETQERKKKTKIV